MSSLRPSKRSLDDAGLDEAQPRQSKQTFTSPGVIPFSQYHDRRISEGGLFNSSGELRRDIPSIETLPQELLLQVFGHLIHPSLLTAGFPDKRVKHYSAQSHSEEDLDSDGFGSAVDRKDLRNVCLVSRTFKTVATTLLYRCAHLAKAKSPESLLLTLTAHPDLQPLVKHISIPTYVGRSTVRFDYAFSHDWLKYMKLNDMETKFPYGNILAECEEAVEGSVLKRIMPLLPNLQTLIIPQISLYEGPIIKDLVLPNLTTLRITLMSPPEDIFERFTFRDSLRTVIGLRPEVLGHDFPALQRLEICTATSTWEANLVSGEGETDEYGCPLKYVESLKTTATSQIAPAEWHLLTLERPIFDSSKLRTLKFDGPGNACRMPCNVAMNIDWDLNRFMSETGGGLRTLSLDWEVHHREEDETQLSYFGPSRHLVKLPQLTNLTHLTVSLQALFRNGEIFCQRVVDMRPDPDAGLARLFPPSLRILRISEYVPGVYEFYGDPHGPDYDDEIYEDMCITQHNRAVRGFLRFLRSDWLMRAEGRELWFRRYAALDWHAELSGNPRGRHLLVSIFGATPEVDGEFERVMNPSQCMSWAPYEKDVELGEPEDEYNDDWETVEESDGDGDENLDGNGASNGDSAQDSNEEK